MPIAAQRAGRLPAVPNRGGKQAAGMRRAGTLAKLRRHKHEQAPAPARMRCGVPHAHRNTCANTSMHSHACIRTAHSLVVQKKAIM